MLLKDKNAIIYGASGGIGSAVARAFAREGARLFLAGRTQATLDAVAQEIAASGSAVETAQVDALNEQAVDAHVQQIFDKTGRIDILFNAIAMQDVQGNPLHEMRLDDFLRPVAIAMQTQFLTARAVARHMIQQGSGVMLTFTAVPDPQGTPNVGGFDPACAALEALWRSFAAELGSYGIRFGVLRSIGSPDTPEVQRTFVMHAEAAGKTIEEYLGGVDSVFLLKQMPPVALIAKKATRMAADLTNSPNTSIAIVTCDRATE